MAGRSAGPLDGLALIGFALPAFWVGAELIVMFAVWLGWFPATGYVSFADSPVAWLQSLVLPVAALSLYGVASTAKQTREAMLDVLASEYIRMAWANGIPARSIVFRHALRNASMRVVTVLGVLAVGLLGGTVLVENVFALPGLGSLMVTAATQSRLPGRRGGGSHLHRHRGAHQPGRRPRLRLAQPESEDTMTTSPGPSTGAAVTGAAAWRQPAGVLPPAAPPPGRHRLLRVPRRPRRRGGRRPDRDARVNAQNAGDLFAVNQRPSPPHLLGTDTLGRDVLARLLVGTQVTMLGVAEALLFVLVLGVPLGLVAGYLGGWIDTAVTWLADLAFSVPAIVIIIVILSVFPENMLAAMSTFGVLAAPGLMRVVRSATLPVRQEAYIEAPQRLGLSRFYILTRHVLPRIAGAVIVQASLLAAVALILQTGLAFLSLLVADPAPSWGGMVADGTSVLLDHRWLIMPPGVAIAVTMLALSLLGDAVRDTATEAWRAAASGDGRSGGQRRRPAPLRPARGTAPAGRGSAAHRAELSVSFPGPGRTRVVEEVSFDVAAGEMVGIVGESGCGKTVTTSAIVGLLPGGGRIDGRDHGSAARTSPGDRGGTPPGPGA